MSTSHSADIDDILNLYADKLTVSERGVLKEYLGEYTRRRVAEAVIKELEFQMKNADMCSNDHAKADTYDVNILSSLAVLKTRLAVLSDEPDTKKEA